MSWKFEGLDLGEEALAGLKWNHAEHWSGFFLKLYPRRSALQ